ncbi:MAG: peptidoglycan DD-metalloendopeptidase family protein [Eubacteriales bacterium]|nr:peptidoglycan DD-metalloendopeptidase family protein [Eubacteriales bacterium]
MDTKFIGAEGYGKFASLTRNENAKKTSAKKFNIKNAEKSAVAFLRKQKPNLKKLVRFIMRAAKSVRHDASVIVKKFSRITWKTLTPLKAFSGIRNFHIKSSDFMFMRTPKGIATACAPVLALFVLIFTICFWTLSDKPLTVSIDGEYIATIEEEAVLTQASANFHDALADTKEDKSLTPVLQVKNPSLVTERKSDAKEVYEKLVDYSDVVVSNAGGLFVDGEFYGASEDADALNMALIDILEQAKAKYDQTTTAAFYNDVQVVTDVYAADTIKSVDTLIEEAKVNFSILIETDLMLTEQVDYETVYEYDDNELNTYCETKVAGENGTVQQTLRLSYVDGVLVDSVETARVVVKEPVTEVLVVGTQESYIGNGDFIWPVPSTGLCTTLFENRWGSFHSGIDIAGSGIYGADIVASDAGTVVFAGDNGSGYGNQVIIDHGNGYSTMYAHCAYLYVSVGDKVSKGTAVAGVGSTGFSTGAHLHFEIWENGTPIDPLNFMTPTSVDRSL